MTKSKYQKIADEIRESIDLGELSVGMAILPELQLQKKYNVSRHTVRQAIALLVNEGYLHSTKGSGTYVDDAYLQKELAPARRKTIGVVTTYLSDYIFPAIIRGIEKEVSQNGYSLFLSSTNNETNLEKECLERMIHQEIDGLIVEPTKSNEFNPNLPYYLTLQERNVPIVMMNAFYEELPQPTVRVDDVQGGFLATNHLLSHGHQSIACIMKTDDLQGKYRLKGFIKAHANAKKTYDSQLIYRYKTETYQETMERLLEELPKHPEITGLVCYNDEVAQEIMIRLREKGIRIPEDLSIIGNDDSALSASAPFYLTTISHPKEQLGKRAAQLLIRGINGEEISDEVIVPHLIERSTVQTRPTKDTI